MSNSNIQNHQYSTTDTALATYLIVEGFTLNAIDYSKPRYEFIFSNNADEIQEHATKYISGNALVDPATYNRVNKKLLRIVKNQLQWWGE